MASMNRTLPLAGPKRLNYPQAESISKNCLRHKETVVRMHGKSGRPHRLLKGPDLMQKMPWIQN